MANSGTVLLDACTLCSIAMHNKTRHSLPMSTAICDVLFYLGHSICLFQTLEFSLRQQFDSHKVQLFLSYEQLGVTNSTHKHAEIQMSVQSLSVPTVHFLAIYNVRLRGKQM
jgi:hypothetical protein